jgi:hypothetical protein
MFLIIIHWGEDTEIFLELQGYIGFIIVARGRKIAEHHKILQDLNICGFFSIFGAL